MFSHPSSMDNLTKVLADLTKHSTEPMCPYVAFDRAVEKIHKDFAGHSLPASEDIEFPDEERSFEPLYTVGLSFRHTIENESISFSTNDLVNAWNVYSEFFTEIANGSRRVAKWHVSPNFQYSIFTTFTAMLDTYQNHVIDINTRLATSEQDSIALLEEKDILSTVWNVSDVISKLLSIVPFDDLERVRKVNEKGATSFADRCAYYSVAILVHLFASLGDYASAIEYSSLIDLSSTEAAIFRVESSTLDTLFYTALSLFQSHRVDACLKLISRGISTLPNHKNMNLTAESPISRVYSLAAVAFSCSPGNPNAGDALFRQLSSRHGDLIVNICGTNLRHQSGSYKHRENTTLNVLDSVKALAGELFVWDTLWNVQNATKDSLDIRRNQRISGFVEQFLTATTNTLAIRSFARAYTSIDVAKLVQLCGLEEDQVYAALIALKIKLWLSESSDNLHFFLNGDVITADEYRAATNVMSVFANGISYLNRVSNKRDEQRK